MGIHTSRYVNAVDTRIYTHIIYIYTHIHTDMHIHMQIGRYIPVRKDVESSNLIIDGGGGCVLTFVAPS